MSFGAKRLLIGSSFTSLQHQARSRPRQNRRVIGKCSWTQVQSCCLPVVVPVRVSELELLVPAKWALPQQTEISRAAWVTAMQRSTSLPQNSSQRVLWRVTYLKVNRG